MDKKQRGWKDKKTLEPSAALIRSLILSTVPKIERHSRLLIDALMKYLSPLSAHGEQMHKQFSLYHFSANDSYYYIKI